MWGVGVSQIAFVWLSDMDVVNRRWLYTADIWINHLEKLGGGRGFETVGGRGFETVSRMTKPFLNEEVKPIFNKDADEI